MVFRGGRGPTHLQWDTITIERATVTQDNAGGPSHAWASHIASVRAHITPLSADETVRYGRESTKRLYQVTVAGAQDITQKDRVVWTSNSNKTMQIISLPAEGDGVRDITMTLVCEEIV